MLSLNPATYFGATNQKTTIENIFTGNSSEAFHVTYALPQDVYTGYFYLVTFTVNDQVSKVKVVIVTGFNETEITEVSLLEVLVIAFQQYV